MNKLCIYHKSCLDGFAAAWIVRFAMKHDIEFHAAHYQEEPPDVTGRDVIIVDFSYKRNIMEKIIRDASSVVVLDHHKTAKADLEGLQGSSIIFDMDRSGARITWDYYFPNTTAPKIVRHIEDRDLWRFFLPGTREICAALYSYPMEFDVWDKFFWMNDYLLAEGIAILRVHDNIVNKLCENPRHLNIAGYVVEASNAPGMFASDIGHNLCQEKPFSATYFDLPTERVFSLRSDNNGMDVSEIAKQYGGGGHQHAAGFKIPIEQASQFELTQQP